MKRTTKAMMCLLLCFMLVVTACGGGGGGDEAGNEAGGESAPSGEEAASGEPSKEQAVGEIVELTVAFPVVTADQQGLQLVEEAMNAITEAKIGARVDFMPINAGEWLQQTNLLFSSNGKLDLTYVHGGMYSNMVARGMLAPLDDLIGQYGGGIASSMDAKYLQATKIGGKMYSVPSHRDMAGSYGLVMRKDLADKHGIDPNALHSLEDVAAALQKIKDGEPDVVPLVPGAAGQSFRDSYLFFDPLGDNMGVLPNYDNGLKVANLFEMPEYQSFVGTIRDWYTKGYILKDAATNKINTFELIRSGKAFAYLAMQKPGFAAQESKASGTELVTAELLPPYTTTSNVTAAMWGIPVQSELKDKAMQFLNLMYEDPEIVNLFSWGVEGTHYVKAEGAAEHIIAYPEGKDASSVGYNSLAWMFGDQFKAYVLATGDPDIWKKTAEFNRTAKPSKALGFLFDSSAVKTEYAAVSNVITQYKLPLETGSVDPEKMLPEFVEKLKAAGIDKIIAEKQKQLDEWARVNAAQ
ncbi:ABC transporter substrate-binding protein [Paenibacillus sp.]|uniref:ABC transporter substrate-binding protein n=1 Tax=Paenibacillus sp. TaxID=58172 RepID=UPI0028116B1F|nr:ABC transporter substrate-binding protein [Paenibacillus sp.]